MIATKNLIFEVVYWLS